MKKFLSLLLALTLLTSLSSCGKEISSADTNDALHDSSLTEYIGMWSSSDVSYEEGGFILTISIDDKEMTIDCNNISSAPSSRIANLLKSIELSEIQNNIATIPYDDDGWGNSGVLELTFNNEYIIADFKNVVLNEMAMWGFYERTYKLIRNDKAQDIITQGSNDYYENNPIEFTPEYDMSKASGILASLGMTEQEFRDSCQALDSSKHHTAIDKKTTVPYVEIIDLQRYPNKYIGQHFVFAKNPYEQLPCTYCHGEDYSRTPSTPCAHDSSAYGNNAKLHSDGLYYRSQKNLNKLVPDELLGRNRYTNSYGESVITGSSYDIFYVYDLRDDIHSPSITSDSTVIAYMIFNGITSDNMLQFAMISCDVIYNN